ncbi:MAG: hypothetical protein WCR67_01700 [Bacilli bacterium]
MNKKIFGILVAASLLSSCGGTAPGDSVSVDESWFSPTQLTAFGLDGLTAPVISSSDDASIYETYSL